MSNNYQADDVAEDPHEFDMEATSGGGSVKQGAEATIECDHCDWSVTSDVATAIAASKAHACAESA